MDAAQFAEFYGAVLHKDTTQQAERTADAKRREQQRILDTQIKVTRACDGSAIPLVRDWFLDIDIARTKMAGDHVETSTLKLVSATLQGPMRRFFERWLMSCNAGAADDAPATWELAKAALRGAYLTSDEGEFLKSELEAMRQTMYETTGAYGRCFMEAADLAYPADARNNEIQSQLLDKYLRGLRSSALVRRVVQEGRPTTLEAAAQCVESYTAQDERVKRLLNRTGVALGRREEPMEVNEILHGEEEDRHRTPSEGRPQEGPRQPGTEVAPVARTTPSLEASINRMAQAMEETQRKLINQVSGLQKEMAKLKGQTLYVDNANANDTRAMPTQDSKPKYAPNQWIDGEPVCYECKQLGHKGRECPVRVARLQGQKLTQSKNGLAPQ